MGDAGLTAPEQIALLKERFDAHPERHAGVDWMDVLARLKASPALLGTVTEMERTGGEPDLVRLGPGSGHDDKPKNEPDGDGALWFADCAAESPAGRRSLCYDDEALRARKANPPAGSALGLAQAMGATVLTEDEYRQLQTVGQFDLKTSSWVLTPPDVRALGGALFCDRRYGRVFVYHNGADSYYGARGFRCKVRV